MTAGGTVAVTARCPVRWQDGHRAVLVAGIVLGPYSVGDRMAEAHAMVSLVEQGWADRREVATASGSASRTVRRLQHAPPTRAGHGATLSPRHVSVGRLAGLEACSAARSGLRTTR
jgi:hypothetical protein